MRSALLQPQKKLEPKTKRFVSGDFMRFCQNVMSNFSTRSRRKSRIWIHVVWTGNCHTTNKFVLNVLLHKQTWMSWMCWSTNECVATYALYCGATHMNVLPHKRSNVLLTRWRNPIGCLESQVIFRKRATKYRALLREMTCKDNVFYDSSPPCSRQDTLPSNVLFNTFLSNVLLWGGYD